MLEQLEWQTLEERRKIASLSIMYKMMNDKLNIDVTGKLKPQERPSRNSNSRALQIPSCRTSVRKESFYPRNIKDWNALPTATILAPSLDSFKARLRQLTKYLDIVFNHICTYCTLFGFLCAHPTVAE